jgi:Domain of unknown function (DUF222)
VHDDNDSSSEALIQGIDTFHAHISRMQRGIFRLIAEADRSEAWQGSGARDMAHWLSMRQGISTWKARRWIEAAHALEDLPVLSEAFCSGELGIDKVVELTRFATTQTEAGLVRWAKGRLGCLHPAKGRRGLPPGARAGQRRRARPVLSVVVGGRGQASGP